MLCSHPLLKAFGKHTPAREGIQSGEAIGGCILEQANESNMIQVSRGLGERRQSSDLRVIGHS